MAITLSNDNINSVAQLSTTEAAGLYAKLNQEVSQSGALDREYLYYLLLTSTEVIGFSLSLVLLIFSINPIVVLASTLGVAYFSVRFGGLVHDAGHRAIFHSPRINDAYGYIISTVIAFPYYVWKVKHNLHHAHPNEEGSDPDLEVPISFTERMYNRDKLVVRIMRRYQAFLFFPLGMFVSFTMRLKALMFYLNNQSKKTGVLFIAHALMIFVWYVGPFIVFPLWKAMTFLIVANLVSGFYMLNVFAPNHKGMPQLEKNTKMSFLERQIITARNITCSAVLNHLYMGLNYQIEHHLFPYCPRNKLVRISPYVKKICEEHQLQYTQMSAIQSTKFILRNLSEASEEFGG